MNKQKTIQNKLGIGKMPGYLKPTARDWFGYDDLELEDAKNEDMRLGISLTKIWNRLTMPMLNSHDITKILGLTPRNLHEWSKRNVMLGSHIGLSNHAWRFFSLKDVMIYAILQNLRRIRIPVGRSYKLAEKLKACSWLPEIMGHISTNQDVVLCTNLEDVYEIILAGHAYRYPLLMQESRLPMVCMRLNGLIVHVLQQVQRDDFHIDVDDKGHITYHVYGRQYRLDQRIDATEPILLVEPSWTRKKPASHAQPRPDRTPEKS